MEAVASVKGAEDLHNSAGILCSSQGKLEILKELRDSQNMKAHLQVYGADQQYQTRCKRNELVRKPCTRETTKQIITMSDLEK